MKIRLAKKIVVATDRYVAIVKKALHGEPLSRQEEKVMLRYNLMQQESAERLMTKKRRQR